MRSDRIYIIAEAGVNHNGSLDLAHKLVDAAADAGADAVKFQTFRAEALVSEGAPKAAYQQQYTDAAESQYQMLKKLELSEAAHRALAVHCRARGIQFLSTPFDEESVDLLVRKIGVSMLKIPSGEITNGPLLLKAARTRKPIVLSTGMSDLRDIEAALGVVAFGYTRPKDAPSRTAFRKAFASPEGRRALRKKVTLLHCTTEYPAPAADVNLKAMDTMREAFGLPVGYSDHTAGMSIPIAAAARGAVLIEKHFTLDRTLPGPDHRSSLEPQELAAMVKAVRDIESALGSGRKGPAVSEKKNITVARRSLVAARNIERNEIFSPENIACKRPGTGSSPLHYWSLLGKRAKKNFRKDEVIVI
jgi:N-acetylneuraminate synthase